MGKLVVLSLLLISPFAHASDFDFTECFANKSEARRIFRDENKQVRCINFGGTKAVEYIYNDGEAIESGGYNYVKGALIGKKFHGFKNLPEGKMFTPTLEFFHTGVLREMLVEFRNSKTLMDIMVEYYPDYKQRHDFVNQLVSEYKSSHELDLPQDFDLITVYEKLQFLQKKFPQEHSDIANNSKDLSILNETTLVQNIHKNFNNNLSIAQCNPVTEVLLLDILKTKRFRQSKIELPTFAITEISQGTAVVYLGKYVLEKLYDKDLAQTKEIIKDKKFKMDKKMLSQRYNRADTMELDIPQTSTLSWVVVHELGHVMQTKIFRQDKGYYKFDEHMLGVASHLLDKKEFPGVPDDLRKRILDELLNPFLDTFEFSAEAYFADTVPCIL